MNLEGSLVLYPPGRIMVIDLLLETVSSPAMGSWPDLQHQACASSCDSGLTSNQKVICWPHSICALSITPMGISGHAGHFCSSQGSQLVRLLMTSLSPNSLHTTFQNEESQSGRSLPFDPNLIYPGFVTKMCDFFFFEVVSQIEFYPATTSNGNNLHYLRGL